MKTILFTVAAFCAVLISVQAAIVKSLAVPEPYDLESEKEILNSSILYWDFDHFTDLSDSEKALKKDTIINQILQGNYDCSGCSKLPLPMICDNLGDIHYNICNFHCSSRKPDQGRKPRMIYTEMTSVGQLKRACQESTFQQNKPQVRNSSRAV